MVQILKSIQNFDGNIWKTTGHFEEIGTDGRMILWCILKVIYNILSLIHLDGYEVHWICLV
jgi:hypothetical protein